MWTAPDQYDAFYDIYPQGRLYVARSRFLPGQVVGLPPIIARLEIPEECGEYPGGWFSVNRYKSMHAIKKEIESHINNGMLFIPDWLLADCFSYHYFELKRGLNV